MTIDLLKRFGWFMVFLLVQAIVLGRIHLFGFATPLLYVYFVASFERNYPKWGILLWSFLLGLGVDVFSNTPGVAAASLTVIGAIQPYFFEMFLSHDSADNLRPSLKAMGQVKYSYYIITLVLLYSLLFYTLAIFNFYNWLQWFLCVIGSAAITLILVFTIEIVGKSER